MFPYICISHIADAMEVSVQLVASPRQSIRSLNACLGKPGGGLRTICKTLMTDRLYNKVSTKVNEWERNMVANDIGCYETARKGSSALDVALSTVPAIGELAATGKLESKQVGKHPMYTVVIGNRQEPAAYGTHWNER